MTHTPEWRQSWRKRVQVAAIGGLGYPLLAALGSTYRYAVRGGEHLRAAQALGQPIHAFWHGRILPATIYFRNRRIVVITSENFDGEWIARIITRFGYGTARGSSSRGARRALLQMVRDVREQPVAFTVDGPRGPARVAQPGAVWLSKATGNPVLPFHIEAARAWTLRSWDRTQVPKPFTRIALSFAEPFVVERGADDEALEQARVRLERSLAACERRCRAMLAADDPGAADETSNDGLDAD
jgi:lysophospholipid acyltransferase (LPLAT)-like uncharacterized protein